MRAAVYNAHWTTLGGGEQLAGGVAAALARSHDVELLVSHSFDAIRASERLGFDLTGFPQLEIPHGTRAFLEASERYDILANTSFGCTFPSRAARSIYYVHFPMPNGLVSPFELSRWRMTSFEPLGSWIEREHGFWLREFSGCGSWTRREARIDLQIPDGMELPFRFALSARAWPPGRAPHVRVTMDDEVLYEGTVSGRRRVPIRTTVVGRGTRRPIPVTIVSDTFVPRIDLGVDDDRELGVVVSHVYLGRRLPSARPSDLALLTDIPIGAFVTEFLDTYQSVVANSAYTAHWVEKLWGRTPSVIPPPVRLRQPGPKQRIILAVGRFFPNISGHSKKQLELVQAFRLACERGLEGWELHLAGGCSNAEREYVETVRRAAVGLPVRFHVNTRGEDLDQLLAAASLFWHGAGLGEDLHRHPDRFEHFGISVVEAMSAGAVPMVYKHGGPAAMIGDAGCGVLYSTIDELAERTVALVRDPDEIDRRSEAAMRRAEEFSFGRFAAQLDDLVASIDQGLEASSDGHA
jgi:glycosyltransferase involved in cell wall biosynthesis